jgi:hypothetical protein
MKLFIPLEDETHAQLNENDRLVPYQAGMALFSQVEILAVADEPENRINPDATSAHPPSEPPIRRLCRR